jgi:hypothetical protein
MYKRWHTRMYAFLKKCYRKADHLPQPFLGSTSLYETCMYRRADSCTLALYVRSWRLYRRVRRQFLKKILYGCMFVCIHIQTMHIPCTYMAWTISLCHEQKIQKGNMMQSSSFEPTIVCIAASCLDHYATSMLARYTIVAVYVYCFSTWLGRLVRGAGPAAPPAPLAAMTSQARASAWISLKPRSAAKQALPDIAFGPGQASSWLGSSWVP